MMNLFSRRPAWAAYFVLSLVILVSSCEKPEESLGLELLPEESLLGLQTYTDSTLLSTYTVLADSARSNELSRALLGELNLPDFGTSNANIYCQVRLSALAVDITGGGDALAVGLDSLVLSFEYLESDSLYGEEVPMQFFVQQLAEDEALYLDSLYYSNASTPVGDNLMFSDDPITPAPADSVELFGLMYPPQLRLRLSEDLGNQLIEEALAEPTSFDDVSDFIEYIRGFKISATSQGPTGAILGLDLLAAQSKLTLYYHNETDTSSFDFVINENAQRYLEFEHDYSMTSELQAALDDPGNQDTDVFIQSMAGVNVKVDLPAIVGLSDTLQAAFNKVELVLPVNNPMLDEAYFPNRLFAVYEDEDGDVISIPDIFEGEIHSDGRYNAENGEYRINITRFAQQVATGIIAEPSLQILPVSNAITANAVRLNGAGNPMGGAKLVVTYTKYE
jgi:hypothetical protein